MGLDGTERKKSSQSPFREIGVMAAVPALVAEEGKLKGNRGGGQKEVVVVKVRGLIGNQISLPASEKGVG